MKVKVSIEMEVDLSQISKYEIDGVITGALDAYGIKVENIGAYTDEIGLPVTGDFFIVDEVFAKNVAKVLRSAGVDEDTIEEFVRDEKLLALHRDWLDYVEGDTSNLLNGREQFKKLVQKHFTSVAA